MQHIGISDELLVKMLKDHKLYRGDDFRLTSLNDWANYTCLTAIVDKEYIFSKVYSDIKNKNRMKAQDAKLLSEIGINIYAGLTFYYRDKEHCIFSYDEIHGILHLMYISFDDFYNIIKVLIDKIKIYGLDKLLNNYNYEKDTI